MNRSALKSYGREEEPELVSGPQEVRLVSQSLESENFITVENLCKTFHTKEGDVNVLNGLSFKVEKGDIFGVVGFSGAGKSTMIRCLNCLETPDSGKIVIGENQITSLSKKDLRRYRRKIGMIFQNFNLFDTKTVFSNIAYPLKIAGYDKKAIRYRVDEILELVELKDKINCYPGQLSGGQK